MSGEAGAPGTAGDGFRVPVPAGRHRAPPAPPRPDRFIVPIAAAAAILTAASLIAITAPAVAPDARHVTGNGATVSTAARTARTVHVPLTIRPATVPTIGAEGAWDPETDAPIPVSAPRTLQSFAGSTGTGTAPTTLSGESVPLTGTPDSTTTTTTTSATTRSTAQTTTPSPTSSTAAATPSSATPTTEEPVTPTADPTPTDIGDVIDEVLGTEVAP